MIACLIQDKNTSQIIEESASRLAKSLGKTFQVAYIDDKVGALSTYCEANDVSFLFIQLIENKRVKIQKILTACRDLRIPYLLFKNSFELLQTNKIVVPVNFLEEEVEKAQFASAFGRFCHSEIYILQANDYGSKATTNVSRMCELFEKFSLKVHVEKAKSDSFKVEKEALNKALEMNAGIILITASREYGLDDILFGPKELHLVQKSNLALLIINPRADLYALCD